LFFDPSGEGNIEFGALAAPNITTDQVNYGAIQVIGYNSANSFGNGTQLGDLSDMTNQSIAGTVYTYLDVVCMIAGTPPFQRSGSDAATVSAHFIFGRMVEPFSANANTVISPQAILQNYYQTPYTPSLGYTAP
jgi:hypothetical protein